MPLRCAAALASNASVRALAWNSRSLKTWRAGNAAGSEERIASQDLFDTVENMMCLQLTAGVPVPSRTHEIVQYAILF